jgi:hypothetical protein
MRVAPLIAAAAVAFGVTQATAQPKTRSMDPGLVTTNVAYDDLNCAARYTLAAFVIQQLDTTAAAYYAQRASDAGKRYLALHPSETEQTYSNRVVANAQDIQAKLAANSITPEGLVAEIKHCDQDADSRVVR